MINLPSVMADLTLVAMIVIGGGLVITWFLNKYVVKKKT